MPWRMPRRWWWCGCDGSGVRRRRVRGRRGWRGGVGCGWHRFTHWAVAVPGAVAPERAPRLQGLARGPGGGARVGGAHGFRPMRPAPSSKSRPVQGDGQALATVVVPGPRGRRRRGACAAGSPARGRRPRCRCPVRLLVAQPTMRRENRPRDEGGAAEPRPGRHVGEVDHPAPVWAGGGEVAAQRAERGPGSPWRARWCALSCPARRRSDSGARMRRTRGAPGHPGALLPGVEQPPGLPGSQRRVERLGPQGEDPLVQGGVRDRPLGGRAGPGGVIGGRGDPAPRLGQDGADPGGRQSRFRWLVG